MGKIGPICRHECNVLYTPLTDVDPPCAPGKGWPPKPAANAHWTSQPSSECPALSSSLSVSLSLLQRDSGSVWASPFPKPHPVPGLLLFRHPVLTAPGIGYFKKSHLACSSYADTPASRRKVASSWLTLGTRSHVTTSRRVRERSSGTLPRSRRTLGFSLVCSAAQFCHL